MDGPFCALLQAVGPFSGGPNEDAFTWLLKLDRLALALGCADNSKLAVALSKLDGTAYNWSESSVFPVWETFKAGFLSRFCDDPKLMRQRFHRCKQLQGEGVRSFADRFKVLAVRARMHDAEELADKFLGGLIPALYDRVIVACPTSFDDTVEKAIYFEQKLRLNNRSHVLDATDQEQRLQPSGRDRQFRPPPNSGLGHAGLRSRPGPGPYHGEFLDRGPRSQPQGGTAGNPSTSNRVDSLNRDFGRMSINTFQRQGGDPAFPRANEYSHPICQSCGHPGHMTSGCPNQSRARAHQFMTITTVSPVASSACIPLEEDWSDWEDDLSDDDFSSAPSQGSRTTTTSEQPRHHTPPPPTTLSQSNMTVLHATDEDVVIYTGAPPTQGECEPRIGARWADQPVRSRLQDNSGVPSIMEHMEIDQLPTIPRPRLRKPFPSNPSEIPARDLTGVQPGGPKVIRRAPQPKTVRFQDEVLPTNTLTPLNKPGDGLGRHEVKILEELLSMLKIRNIGVEEMANTRMRNILMALSDRLHDYANGRDPKPPIPNMPLRPVELYHVVSEPTLPDLTSTESKEEIPIRDLNPSRCLYYDVLRAPVKVYGIKVLAVIDSGASACAVSQSLVQKLGLLDSVEEVDAMYRNADSVLCQGAGLLRDMPVQIGSLLLKVDGLVIASASYDLLLGVDYLSAAGASISFVDKTLEFSVGKNLRSKIPIRFTTLEAHTNPAINTLTSSNSVPPQSEFTEPVTRPDWALICVTRDLILSNPGMVHFIPESFDDAVNQLRQGYSFDQSFSPSTMSFCHKVLNRAAIHGLITPDVLDDKVRDGPIIDIMVLEQSEPSGPIPEFTLHGIPLDMGQQLTHNEALGFFNLLSSFDDVFSTDKADLGCTDVIMHTIDTGDAKPFKIPSYKLSYGEKDVVRSELKRMLDAGVIEPCNSPWSSPIVLVPKPHSPGELRWCQNFIRLNSITRNIDAYRSPDVRAIIDSMGKSHVFSVYDLTASYWQILVHPDSRDKTAFSVPYLGTYPASLATNPNDRYPTPYTGQFRYRRLPMGLVGAAATMTRLMDVVLAPGSDCATTYIDDICIHNPHLETHERDVKKVLTLLRNAVCTHSRLGTRGARLKLSVKKSKTATDSVCLLGFSRQCLITWGRSSP